MSNNAVEQEKDFTVAMQQLSAEAEKIRPAMPIVTDNSSSKSPDQTESASPPKILAEQLQTLENKLLGRIEKLSADMDATRRAAFAQHFKKIEPPERVDRACHRVISYEPADFPEEDGAIVMRVKRGFVWRGKLIRPEEVIAKRCS